MECDRLCVRNMKDFLLFTSGICSLFLMNKFVFLFVLFLLFLAIQYMHILFILFKSRSHNQMFDVWKFISFICLLHWFGCWIFVWFIIIDQILHPHFGHVYMFFLSFWSQYAMNMAYDFHWLTDFYFICDFIFRRFYFIYGFIWCASYTHLSTVFSSQFSCICQFMPVLSFTRFDLIYIYAWIIGGATTHSFT